MRILQCINIKDNRPIEKLSFDVAFSKASFTGTFRPENTNQITASQKNTGRMKISDFQQMDIV